MQTWNQHIIKYDSSRKGLDSGNFTEFLSRWCFFHGFFRLIPKSRSRHRRFYNFVVSCLSCNVSRFSNHAVCWCDWLRMCRRWFSDWLKDIKDVKNNCCDWLMWICFFFFSTAYNQHQQEQAELNGSYVPADGPDLSNLRLQMGELQLNKQELETKLIEKEERVQRLVSTLFELAMPWLRSAQRLFQGSICELAMPWLRSAQRLFQGSICELAMPWLRSAQRLFQGSICELASSDLDQPRGCFRVPSVS